MSDDGRIKRVIRGLSKYSDSKLGEVEGNIRGTLNSVFNAVVACLVVLSLSSCSLATHPGDISPLPSLKDNRYSSLSCKELNVMNISNSEELTAAVGTQLKLYKNDQGFGYGAISGILFFGLLLLLIGVDGDDEQKVNRIRELKANDKQIRIAAVEKECFFR